MLAVRCLFKVVVALKPEGEHLKCKMKTASNGTK